MHALFLHCKYAIQTLWDIRQALKVHRQNSGSPLSRSKTALASDLISHNGPQSMEVSFLVVAYHANMLATNVREQFTAPRIPSSDA